MNTAIITFSEQGCAIAARICAALPEAELFVHKDVKTTGGITPRRFEKVLELTTEIFNAYKNIVYIGPCGVAVRALAPHVRHKTTDPAVVVVDVGARYAISLLSGHEGGANGLAVRIANIIGAEPVITTTTEAEKSIIVGVGCKKGTEAGRIIEAVLSALAENNIDRGQVRCLASADIKAGEPGLIQAAETLELPLRIIPSETIRTFAGAFEASDFVMEKTGLPAVAEPAALLAGRRTSLILKKTKYGGITIAIARENFI